MEVSPQNPPAETLQIKILIIDDEKALRESLKKILERAGYLVEIAQDYYAAHKCLDTTHFDLLLVDIVLPKMSGVELIQSLRNDFPDLGAVIFITGEPNLETALGAIRVGAYDYLEKPITRDALIQVIQNVTERYRHQLQIAAGQQLAPSPKSYPMNSPEKPKIDEIFIAELKEDINSIYRVLFELKKKYGDLFTEAQKIPLNQIATIINKIRDNFTKYNL